MSQAKLFVASCMSIGTAAMSFALRGDAETAMSKAFYLSKEQVGFIWLPAFYAFAIAIFISGALADVIGMRILHILSALCFIGGVLLIDLAPYPQAHVASLFDHPGTTMLYAGFFMFGLAHGFVEGTINPLISSIYPTQKTRRIIQVHAWWPAGLIISGLIAIVMTSMQASWQLKLGILIIPAIGYLLIALTEKYPQTERVISNVSTAEMWKQVSQPLFLVLFACMWMTAAVEMGPGQWLPSVMQALVPQFSPGKDASGILFLVYVAGLMFVLRMFFGWIAHKFPIGTLVCSPFLAGLGLFWLGSLNETSSAASAMAAATLFGVGTTFLWPTMLGVTAEQFPRGGALLLSLMGAAGMLSVGFVLPIMGKVRDVHGAGAAFKMVAALCAILVVIFCGVWFYFKSKGGYSAVHISTGPAGTTEPVGETAGAMG